MKIQLPLLFEYSDGTRQTAYVEEGVLHLCSLHFGAFEKTMYALTYAMKGKETCYYCGEPLEKRKITLDHIYPRSFGGFSIPENLKPCCAKCNSQKGELLPEQYRELRLLKDPQVKKARMEQYRQDNAKMRGERGIILPEDWYEMRKDYTVMTTFTSEQTIKGSKKYQNLQELYECYGKICKAVVVSSNGVVLDGFLAVLLAKNLGQIIPIPFVTLENVIVNI